MSEYRELQKKAKELGLKAVGSTEVLKERIAGHEESEKEEVEEVEGEPEVAESAEEEVKEEPELRFGVNSALVDRVKDVSVYGRPMKKVFLANGSTSILSEEELEVRLEEGEK